MSFLIPVILKQLYVLRVVTHFGGDFLSAEKVLSIGHEPTLPRAAFPSGNPAISLGANQYMRAY